MATRKTPKGFLLSKNKDYAYAGIHLIVEFWQAKNLNSEKMIEKILKNAVEASGSDLLNIYVHKFSEKGVTGVAAISESHISIHTWPEEDYVAIDIFTCGKTKPYKALEVLKSYFKPKHTIVKEIKRGISFN